MTYSLRSCLAGPGTRSFLIGDSAGAADRNTVVLSFRDIIGRMFVNFSSELAVVTATALPSGSATVDVTTALTAPGTLTVSYRVHGPATEIILSATLFGAHLPGSPMRIPAAYMFQGTHVASFAAGPGGALAASEDGKLVAVTSTAANTVSVYSVDSGMLLRTFSGMGKPNKLCFHSERSTLIVAGV